MFPAFYGCKPIYTLSKNDLFLTEDETGFLNQGTRYGGR